MPFKGSPTYAPALVPKRLRDAWNLGSDGIAKNLKRAKTARPHNPFRRLKMQHEDLVLKTVDGVSLNAWFVTPPRPRRDGLMVLGRVVLARGQGHRLSSLSIRYR